MNIGDYRIEQLSEGIFEVSSAGSIRKIRDHQQEKSPLASVERVGLDPILIDTGTTCILLDTGLGIGLDKKDPNQDSSNILTNLGIFGYRATDIKHVIMSHLHYDHAAGLSYSDIAGRVTATLPNARIHVQNIEWEAALRQYNAQPVTRGMGYETDDLYRLVADGRFVFLNKEYQEIFKGITVIRTGGHTPGHQIVRIRNCNETAYYCGDLIPADSHLNHYLLRRVDTDSIKARKAKTLLMQQAYRDKATLLFYHSIYQKAGKISRDKNRKFVLKSG